MNKRYIFNSWVLTFNMGITAVVLTYNEERYIRGCLETLDWVDQIIVMDENSSDRTVSIANEYTDDIYQVKTSPDQFFGSLRHEAIERSEHEWIIRLDADERLTKPVIHKFKQIVSSDQYNVVEVPRRSYVGERPLEGVSNWPDYTPLLFNRDVLKKESKLHSDLNFSDSASVLQLSPIETYAIPHYTATSVIDFWKKMHRYGHVGASTEKFRYENLILQPVKTLYVRMIRCRGYREGFFGLLLVAAFVYSDILMQSKLLLSHILSRHR